MFPNKIAACEYFASAMSKSFAVPDRGCAMCGRESDQPPFTFIWRANLHTSKTILISFVFSAMALAAHHIYSQWHVVEFATTHRLCAQCEARHRRRQLAVGLLRHVLFAVLMLLVFVGVPALIFSIAAPFIGLGLKGYFVLLGVVAAGLAVLALVLKGFEWCRTSLIPRSLLRIRRLPFVLHKLRKDH